MIGSLWKGVIQDFGNLNLPQETQNVRFGTPTPGQTSLLGTAPKHILQRGHAQTGKLKAKGNILLSRQKQRSNYVIRETVAPKVKTNDSRKITYKYQTFLKMVVPVFVGDAADYGQALKMTLAYIKDIWTSILNGDPYGSAILPWVQKGPRILPPPEIGHCYPDYKNRDGREIH